MIGGNGYHGAGPFGGGRTYDLSLDARRFLMIKQGTTNDAAPPSFVVVINWAEELTQRVPAR